MLTRGQKRKRDGKNVFPTVDPKELEQEGVEKLERIVKDAGLPASLQKSMEGFLNKYRGQLDVTMPATDFLDVERAARAVGVKYDPYDDNHLWNRKDNELKIGDGKLSDWADVAVTMLRKSRHFKLNQSEATIRTIAEIILCDRLGKLDDNESAREWNWFSKVPVSVRSDELHSTIKGRADWCLAQESRKGLVDTALVVWEAKKLDTVKSGLPQLLLYLAGIQESRKKAHKVNSSVFGISTDSSDWVFAYLDEKRNLYTTQTYEWRLAKDLIVKWIDNVLHDAIRASPATALVNTSLMNYNKYIKTRYDIGSSGEDRVHWNNNVPNGYKVVCRPGEGYFAEPMSDDDSEGNKNDVGEDDDSGTDVEGEEHSV